MAIVYKAWRKIALFSIHSFIRIHNTWLTIIKQQSWNEGFIFKVPLHKIAEQRFLCYPFPLVIEKRHWNFKRILEFYSVRTFFKALINLTNEVLWFSLMYLVWPPVFLLPTAKYFGWSDSTLVCSKGHWLKNMIYLSLTIWAFDRSWI